MPRILAILAPQSPVIFAAIPVADLDAEMFLALHALRVISLDMRRVKVHIVVALTPFMTIVFFVTGVLAYRALNAVRDVNPLRFVPMRHFRQIAPAFFMLFVAQRTKMVRGAMGVVATMALAAGTSVIGFFTLRLPFGHRSLLLCCAAHCLKHIFRFLVLVLACGLRPLIRKPCPDRIFGRTVAPRGLAQPQTRGRSRCDRSRAWRRCGAITLCGRNRRSQSRTHRHPGAIDLCDRSRCDRSRCGRSRAWRHSGAIIVIVCGRSRALVSHHLPGIKTRFILRGSPSGAV